MGPEWIGEQLRAARVVRNLSRREAAEAIGVTERTLYTWEVGKAMPSLDKALKLSDLYGKSLDELVGRSGRPEGSSEMDEIRRQLSALRERIERIAPSAVDEPGD